MRERDLWNILVWCFLFLLFYPAFARADLTGVGDAKIIAELVKIVETTNDMLEEAQRTTDSVQELKTLESNKTLNTLVNNARELENLASEIQRTENLTDDFLDSRGGLANLKNEVEGLRRQYERAGNLEGAARMKAYARTIQSIDQLSILEEQANATLGDVGNGMSEDEANKIEASSSAVIAKILVDREARELQEQAARQEEDELARQFNDDLIHSYNALESTKKISYGD